ncbi:MAG: hypothetical protein ACFBRM_03805 [Pikeienuella sp.]
MDAGTAFQIISLLAIGAGLYGFFFQLRMKQQAKDKRITYYRRIVTDLRNAEAHYTAQRAKLAGLLDLDEMAQRALLEDAKFAAHGHITYETTDFHYITEAEADRMLALTTELKATDATIEACQEAAMQGSNLLPALHADLMSRIERITAEAGDLKGNLTPRGKTYTFSD